jgi:proline iminopeptidase
VTTDNPRTAYPSIEPHASGLLDVGDGHHIYWEVSGNPVGKPALVVHGGPGSGATPWWRTLFDPNKYRIVLFDQRNCGRSLPHASDPDVDLSTNTTAHLVADMERLRERLGIDRWLLCGGSWGSTLSLAYAVEHSQRVTELALFAVVTTRRHEVEWLTRTIGGVFPAAWDRFVAAVPEAERTGNLAAAYHRLLMSPTPEICDRAAVAWCEWEGALVSLERDPVPSARFQDPIFRLAFTRIVTHYFANAAFLDDQAIVGRLDRIAHIPAVLIRGRLDVGSPLRDAWQLVQQWPAAELIVEDDAGHAGAAAMNAALIKATDEFAVT